MQAALYLLGLWALAFITLCAALVLLNIFDGIIGNDLMLNSAGKEAVMAAVASLIEGGVYGWSSPLSPRPPGHW